VENSATSHEVGSLELLERSQHLRVLEQALAKVLETHTGQLVLVRGEAGVGKSALVRRFCEEQCPPTRILWGACEALFTPYALGPFLDVARSTGGELAELVAGGGRPHAVLAALAREVTVRTPTVLVIEDLHWADEATLDVLRLLGRRFAGIRALVLATYRDDELDRGHPLRVVLGELATGRGIERLDLAPLSLAAVAQLAKPYGISADELYRSTGGNPFFVTEVLGAGAKDIPHTIRDAVLARAARLSGSARSLLDPLAIMAPEKDLRVLEAVAGEAIESLDECLASAMLVADARGVAFRHELARLVIEESMSPRRKLALHSRALRALTESPTTESPPARLAHHAEACGDGAAVLRFAPQAAVRAAAVGAHRESAAEYGRALRFAQTLGPERRAELLEHRAHECMVTDQTDEAIEALHRAIELRRGLGDLRAEGQVLHRLSDVLWCPGRVAEARQAAQQAVAVLEPLGPGRELAMAYSRVSEVCLDAEDTDGAISWGTRALELAQALDEPEIVIDALNNIGSATCLDGAPEGRGQLERCLALAREAGLDEPSARAMQHLAWVAVRQRSYALAQRQLEPALEYVSERGLELRRLYLLCYRAQMELAVGRWDDAVDTAMLVLHEPRRSIVPRIVAHTVIGRVRARRGDPDIWPPLDQALSLAAPSDDLQAIEPVALARAEASWLAGKPELVAEVTERAFELAIRRRARWTICELACWRWRAGVDDDPLLAAARPYALEIDGSWAQAADHWMRIGCPYERALALASADDEHALRLSLTELQRLGARPAVAIVQRRLRDRGVRRVPRGPRPSTRQSRAGLTARELDVVVLVAEGLRNSEIAQRLVVSERTVDHHVGAILRKLDVRTRGEASVKAGRLGLIAPS
jgi:DNA-binding CsgD family transcriptional regulator/tetratricopeptide (TPR) repeat protein